MTPQLYTLLKQTRGFLSQHHPVLFIAMIALLLGFAVYMLYEILNTSASDPNQTTSTIGTFDKKTVDKIKNLHISGSNGDTTLTFPSPRANPFVEE